jgi:hypothetical protein
MPVNRLALEVGAAHGASVLVLRASTFRYGFVVADIYGTSVSLVVFAPVVHAVAWITSATELSETAAMTDQTSTKVLRLSASAALSMSGKCSRRRQYPMMVRSLSRLAMR